MSNSISLRPTTPQDLPALMALYPQAFPDEDLRGIVGDLLAAGPDGLSLAAFQAEALIGHILFTRCTIGETGCPVALLAPMAVHPDHQRQGLGRTLIEDGCARLKQDGFEQVLVLGDPGYYGRVGFALERAVTPPYALPDAWHDAWQSRRLSPETETDRLTGPLQVPPPWQDPVLWGP